ncbi:MAG: L,D-transpeptidase family protein [Caulobacteraceae bacterium]
MIFTVNADGWMELAGERVRCCLGRSGVIEAARKREGDGATPIGIWPLRGLLYRPDRGQAPATNLAASPIARDDGWCDAPDDPRYNRKVRLPYPSSAEQLWRTDHLYDLVLVVGYNDAPVAPRAGSAIFIHLADAAYAPTRGCVAIARADLERLLRLAASGDAVSIG